MGIVPPRPSAGGHGILPVPPDGPCRPRHPPHRRRARRRRDPAQLGASASWSATPRRSKTSLRATSWPAPWPTKSRGPRLRPEQGLRPAGLTHLEPAPSRPNCPTSPSSPAPTSASTLRSRFRSCRPRTTPWAASRPTSMPRCSRTTTPSSRAVRRRRVRLRLRARLQPSGHQLAAGHQRLRQARRHAAAQYVQTADFVPLPEDPAADALDLLDLRTSDGTERIAVIRKELQETMDGNMQVFRTDESLNQVLTDIASSRALQEHPRPGQGQAVQPRPARGRRTRLPARSRRGHDRGRPQPQGVPRRTHPRGLPGARRRKIHEALDGVQG